MRSSIGQTRSRAHYSSPALLCLVISTLVALVATRPAAAQLSMQVITPHESHDALVNPGMGLYLPGTLRAEDMPENVWFSKLVNIGYFRDDWSKLEPDAEGQYKFDEYFRPIFDLWVKRWHKRVAFRFMAENMHSRAEVRHAEVGLRQRRAGRAHEGSIRSGANRPGVLGRPLPRRPGTLHRRSWQVS